MQASKAMCILTSGYELNEKEPRWDLMTSLTSQVLQRVRSPNDATKIFNKYKIVEQRHLLGSILRHLFIATVQRKICLI